MLGFLLHIEMSHHMRHSWVSKDLRKEGEHNSKYKGSVKTLTSQDSVYLFANLPGRLSTSLAASGEFFEKKKPAL